MEEDIVGGYWSKFWSGHDASAGDDQSQVLRVRNNMPISESQWQFTLKKISEQFPLTADDCVIDLCAGNGLFSAEFAPVVSRLYAVDISPGLVKNIRTKNLPNVTAIESDVRQIQFEPGLFSKVFWYAGIQYLGEQDIVDMLYRIRQWMRPGGLLFVGDIPDRSKLWAYFNDEARRAAYFDGIRQGRPIIGTWLDKIWLENLCTCAGFSSPKAVDQDPALIYADFRFDLTAST